MRTQVNAGFSGNLVLQNTGNQQFIGKISLRIGEIVAAGVGSISGRRALMGLVMYSEENPGKIIVEPGVIAGRGRTCFSSPSAQELDGLEQRLAGYRRLRQLRPPDHLRLRVSFSLENSEFLPYAVDLLATIADYSLVRDIYRNSNLMAWEVTIGLIGLRKKGVLRVIP